MQSRIYDRVHHILSTLHPHTYQISQSQSSDVPKSVKWTIEENSNEQASPEAILYFTNLSPQCWQVRTLIHPI
jgi:hypothetical protein